MAALPRSTCSGILVFLRKKGGRGDDCDGYTNIATRMNCISVIRRPGVVSEDRLNVSGWRTAVGITPGES